MLEPIHQNLQSLNTLGLPSVAHRLLTFKTVSQLPELSRYVAQQTDSVLVLGGGSNVVLPAQVHRVVVHMANTGWRVLRDASDHVLVQVQAGHMWHSFVEESVKRHWYGLENLALIPGTVGAAPVQNIGAYGVEVAQAVHSVIAWNFNDHRLHELPVQACGFAYRDSVFKQALPGQWMIVAVRFRLSKQWAPCVAYPDLRQHPLIIQAQHNLQAQDVFDAVCAIRRAKLPDPAVLGNAGSFFKNPVVDAASAERLRNLYPDIVMYPQPQEHFKLAAGWLIDRAGWKGRRQGPVGVHDRQALVLVNHGNGTAADIHALALAIQNDVFTRFGVWLEQEPINVLP